MHAIKWNWGDFSQSPPSGDKNGKPNEIPQSIHQLDRLFGAIHPAHRIIHASPSVMLARKGQADRDRKRVHNPVPAYIS